MNHFLKKLAVYCLIAVGGASSVMAGLESTNSFTTNSVSPPTKSVMPEYLLHPDDVIEVRVYGEDNLTSKARLNENGEVVLPLLAPLKVGGSSIQEAKIRITQAYKKDYLINPVVTVSIAEYGNSKVTVLGQVRNPGVYEFPSNEKLNLLQAIALAGGYTRIGAPSRVTIKRTEGGKATVIRLDAKSMVDTDETAIIEAYPDDVINVGETIF